MEDVIHWITEHKEERSPNRKVSHKHPKREHQEKKHPRIGVWRAEEAKADEGE